MSLDTPRCRGVARCLQLQAAAEHRLTGLTVLCYTGHMADTTAPRTGVTVTQYQGPEMRFETAEEYGEWLLSGDPDDPDFAVDLHEHWDDPSYETTGQHVIDVMFEKDGRY